MLRLISTIAIVAVTIAFADKAFARHEIEDTGKYPHPPAGHQGQWYVTPDGACTYSRVIAPGHGVRWMLVQNPHHLGNGDSADDCPIMM